MKALLVDVPSAPELVLEGDLSEGRRPPHRPGAGTSSSSAPPSRATGLKSRSPQLPTRAGIPPRSLLNTGTRKRPRSSSANQSPLARRMAYKSLIASPLRH